MSGNGEFIGKIAALTAGYAEFQDNGSASTSAIIECIVGAATPMVGDMFSGGTIQERFLFTLVLAGACATLTDEGGENFGLKVEISPETLTEAFSKFTGLTGVDIRPYLPKPMVSFAAQRSLH